MSFRSVIQDPRGETGSVSKKGFELKLAYGFRSKSHRLVNNSTASIDSLKDSCWTNVPPELLRDVLTRIESTGSSWPMRRSVVACAGVCKNWRDIVKDIVKTPEISGKLTFPISLKQPGPRDSLLQCFIKRDRSTHTYYLFLGLTAALHDDGKFLLAARKSRRPTCTDYIISYNPRDISKGCNTYIGKLRSHFLGTRFTVYDSQPPLAESLVSKSRSTRLVGLKQVYPRVPPAGNYAIAHIAYDLNVLGSRGPRRMHCTMDYIPASAILPNGTTPTPPDFSPTNLDSCSFQYLRSKSSRSEKSPQDPSTYQKVGTLILKNKSPRWHEQLQCWCLNFRGRVTLASVKNFQLVASPENGSAGPEHEQVLLQFGKVAKDIFTMDYRYPLSAFQSFAICLSSFDTKIACE